MGKATSRRSKERRGPVLDVLQELLAEGRNDQVVQLFEQLVAKNGELEKRLAEIGARRKKNEGLSRDQLLLFLDALATAAESAAGTDEERDEANLRLRSAAGVDEHAQRDVGTQETREPRTQPPLRRAPPAHLRRIDNPLAVPATERPCPKCGAERKCIGHDVTEVIELIPAEVVVRRDSREKLACSSCDGELRAGASGGSARVARSARALTRVKAWSRC